MCTYITNPRTWAAVRWTGGGGRDENRKGTQGVDYAKADVAEGSCTGLNGESRRMYVCMYIVWPLEPSAGPECMHVSVWRRWGRRLEPANMLPHVLLSSALELAAAQTHMAAVAVVAAVVVVAAAVVKVVVYMYVCRYLQR